MRTTIDSAGRLVVPKAMREAMRLEPGRAVDIVFTDGRLEIELAPAKVHVERRGSLPVLVPDALHDPAFAAYREIFSREGIEALAFIPLVSGGRLIGKFMVYFDHPHQLSRHELELVQAIANQTFKEQATPESLKVFGSRLRAMAAAHDLLVTENWETADLRESVVAALDPFGFDRRRFSLEGPHVQITAKAALSLAMALHELCTNAAKYGALSVPDGRVTVCWRIAPGGRFQLTWTERGGPEVSAPERSGFGSRLIQSALGGELGGTAELAFPAAGVAFALDADAAMVVAGWQVEGTAA